MVLSSTADWISRHLRFRRVWALALTLLLLLVTFSLTIWLVGDRVSSEVQDLAQQQLPSAAASLAQTLGQHSWGQALLRSMPSPENLLSHGSEMVRKSQAPRWDSLEWPAVRS